MSVTPIDLRDLDAVVAQISTDALGSNFFTWLGTQCCSRGCLDEASIEGIFEDKRTNESAKSLSDKEKRAHKRALRSTRKQRWNQFMQDQEWFTARQIMDSAARGCASCGVLRQIFLQSFSGNPNSLSDDHEYAVTPDFFLKRRALAHRDSEEVSQLFQPPGLNSRFQRLPESGFLFNKELSIKRLREWLDTCSQNHASCRRQLDQHQNAIRPTRLLDLRPIQQNNDHGISLIESQTLAGQSYQYVCLSHRWDAVVAQHRTTTANITDFKQFISERTLPTNFRDAIWIARGINIRYLWIDSLCIIQQGDDGDKQRELGKMGFIYKNAYLTICAISSPNSSKGCFEKDQWHDLGFRVSNSRNEEQLIGLRRLDLKGRPSSVDDVRNHYPLVVRGWIFQERLMSTRLLLCNYGEFAFECPESSCCECGSQTAPHPRATELTGNLTFTRERRFLQPRGDLDSGWVNGALRLWNRMIEAYMKHELTYSSDVLLAIAGCAQMAAPGLGMDYVAGMWVDRLPTDLLWYVHPERLAFPKARPTATTAPSWSWASVAMQQTISHVDLNIGSYWISGETLLNGKIEEVYCRPLVAANPFGMLEHAHLKMTAVLYPWWLRSFCRQAVKGIQSGRHRWHHDLYVDRSFQVRECTTDVKALPLGGAKLHMFLDAPLEDENLQLVDFTNCRGTPTASRRCRLMQTFLLPVIRKQAGSNSMEAFMLLKRISSDPNMSNFYRRIGLMIWANKGEAEPVFWDEFVKDSTMPQQQVFWLF